MEGDVDSARWREALSVSDRFHDIVSGVAWSSEVPGRHPWAIGDAFAWGGIDIAFRTGSGRPSASSWSHAPRSTTCLASSSMVTFKGNILFHPVCHRP